MTTQTKTFSVSIDTSRRIRTDGSSHEGCGKSKHAYVGRNGSYDYDAFVKFAIAASDFDDVGKIVAATLNVYTDEFDTLGSFGEPGIFPAPGSTDKPKATIYRLTSAFTEGNNVDGHFDSTDYVNPSKTTSGGVSASLLPLGANLLHQINILAIFKAWAPQNKGGSGATNYGIGLYGTTDFSQNWSGWAREHSDVATRMSVTMTYELGATTPNSPTVTGPSGATASLSTIDGVFSDPRPTDTLQSTSVEVYDNGHAGTAATSNIVTSNAHKLNNGDSVYLTALTGGAGLTIYTRYYVRAATTNTFKLATTNSDSTIVNITTTATALTWSVQLSSFSQVAPQADRAAYAFHVPFPGSFKPAVGAPFRYRVRYVDQEGVYSPWTSLFTVTLTNNPPAAPVITPLDGLSYTGLNLVKFTGTYSDPDGDPLLGHQIQLSSYPPSDPGWSDADNLAWDTGIVFASLGDTSWVDYYGGRALTAGTYYWRARNFDARNGVSAWSYASLTLTADFSPDPSSYDNVQINPQAPWRILIRNLYQSDGVTKTTGRGPGQLVAVLEEAKSVGASVVYNSPGELHFTLLKDDEQISVIEPKQVHYALEFYSGDGWQEKFAGVIWDMDATETDVVFKGIDYLALWDTIIDERYDPNKPNKSYKSNGSFYENVTIRTVVLDQINRAKKMTDSWVGFIAIGSIATMNEKVTVYSTMQPVLSFLGGLIDSHRQGTGKRTRMRVVKLANSTYQLRIDDDPGTIRADLAMYYGELVQGYRVIAFGDGWANVMNVVGRDKNGSKVVYKTWANQSFQPSTSTYGRIATVAVMDGVQDQLDLNRRGLQAAIGASKLGKQIAIGIRTAFLQVLQGWDVCDVFPMAIKDAAVDTSRFGSGYWSSLAAAWEATDIGEQSIVITFVPREDATAPNPDLIPSQPVSTQPEWQIGWAPPDITKVAANKWLDQSTGKVYERSDNGATLVPVTGSP